MKPERFGIINAERYQDCVRFCQQQPVTEILFQLDYKHSTLSCLKFGDGCLMGDRGQYL